MVSEGSQTFARSVAFHQQRDHERFRMCDIAARTLRRIDEQQSQIEDANFDAWAEFDRLCEERHARGEFRENRLIDLMTRREMAGEAGGYWNVAVERGNLSQIAAAYRELKRGETTAEIQNVVGRIKARTNGSAPASAQPSAEASREKKRKERAPHPAPGTATYEDHEWDLSEWEDDDQWPWKWGIGHDGQRFDGFAPTHRAAYSDIFRSIEQPLPRTPDAANRYLQKEYPRWEHYCYSLDLANSYEDWEKASEALGPKGHRFDDTGSFIGGLGAAPEPHGGGTVFALVSVVVDNILVVFDRVLDSHRGV
jgi:hypothetical protein